MFEPLSSCPASSLSCSPRHHPVWNDEQEADRKKAWWSVSCCSALFCYFLILHAPASCLRAVIYFSPLLFICNMSGIQFPGYSLAPPAAHQDQPNQHLTHPQTSVQFHRKPSRWHALCVKGASGTGTAFLAVVHQPGKRWLGQNTLHGNNKNDISDALPSLALTIVTDGITH